MAQNAKPVDTITWHATKAEKTMRKEGEEALKSNKAIKVSDAVKRNERAYSSTLHANLTSMTVW